VGELLANPKYCSELLTAIHTMKNRESGSNVNSVARTTALFVRVRINDHKTKVIPDSEAAVSIIGLQGAKKLGLPVYEAPTRKLSAFGNPLEVIGQTEAVLEIEDVKMPVKLLVVNSEQETILLGMDWFEDFDVALNIPTKELMFVIERQRYKTFVEFERDGNEINCISGVESQDMRYLGAEGLSAEILCNAVNETTVSDILSETEFRQGKEQVEAYLEKHPEVVFTDEKNATRTDLVQCKLWMKNAKPIRIRVRPLNPEKRVALQKEIDDLLTAGVIRPSKSVYASAPVLVKKKDGT